MSENITFAAAMAVVFLPFSFCTLDSWQRLGAWHRRGKSPTIWLTGSALALSAVYCVPILIGIAVRHSNHLSSGTNPLESFLRSLHLDPGVLGFIFAGFIAAVLSTADELLNCSTFSLIFDLFQLPALKKKETESDEKHLITSAKFYTIVFAIIAGVIALLSLRFDRQISDLAVAIFSGQVVFTVPLGLVLFRPSWAPGLARVAITSMIASFLAACGTVVAGWLVQDKNLVDAGPISAFAVAAITFFVLSLWHSVRRKEK